MPDVVIRLKATKEGWQAFDEAGNKIHDLGREADRGSLDLLNFNAGIGVANTLLGAMKQGLEVASQMNELGTATRRTEQAFSAFTGTHADEYIRSLTKATGGLVDDTDLATDAMFLMSRGIATSSEEIAKITHLGAVLGETFEGSAAKGIEAVNTALEHVGNKRSLYALNVNVPEVMRDFDRLKATLGDEAAWKQAVENGLGKAMQTVGDNFDKPGAGLEKLNTKLQALKEMAAKPVSIVVDFLAGKVLDSNLMRILDEAALKAEQGKTWKSTAIPPGQGFGRTAGEMPPDFSDLAVPTTGVRGSNMTSAEVSARAAMNSAQGEIQGRKELNALIAQGKGLLDQYLGVGKNVVETLRDEMTYTAKITEERARRNQGINAAFGIAGSGLGAEVGQGLDQDVALRRQQLVRSGATKGQLAAFDESSKQAMDAYAIATGQATKESLRYRDLVADIHTEMGKGNLSIQQGASYLAQFANAAKEGSLSIEQVNRMIDTLSGNLDHLQITRGVGDKLMTAMGQTTSWGLYGDPKNPHWEKRQAGDRGVSKTGLRIAQLEGEFGTGTKTNAGDVNNDFSDPFAPQVKSAEKLTAATDKAAQASAGMVVSIGANSLLAANSMQPLYNKAVDVVRQVTNISKALYGLSGDLNVHIGFTVSGSGGGKNAMSQ